MGWLKDLFLGKPKTPAASAVPESTIEPFTIRTQDDATYAQNRDVIQALRFSVTLQIRTPLSVLRHHDESYDGPPSTAPKYGGEGDGMWLYETRASSELGIDLPDFKASTVASDVGPARAEDYLPFLMSFRTIVESSDSTGEKLTKLRLLPTKSNMNREFWKKLENYYEDFPESFFYLQLTDLPGVGKKTARNLFAAGFSTVESVRLASSEDLLRVPGLGSGTVSKIKAT